MKHSRSMLLAPLALLLAACGTPQHPSHGQAMTDACTAHRQSRTPDERRAAAEAHIVKMHGSADAQHIERHLQMMDQRCGAADTGTKAGGPSM